MWARPTPHAIGVLDQIKNCLIGWAIENHEELLSQSFKFAKSITCQSEGSPNCAHYLNLE